MIFETIRITNTFIKITIPVNIAAIFIPKGLNHESFGGVINTDPKTYPYKSYSILLVHK